MPNGRPAGPKRHHRPERYGPASVETRPMLATDPRSLAGATPLVRSRRGGGIRYAAGLSALLVLAAVPARAENEPQPAHCIEASASLIGTLDSASSIAGDAFTFKVTERVAASGAYPEIPPGTRGFGIVSFADHARGSGRPGRLAVEPRFLKFADGTRVPVIADPQLAEGFVEGESRNLNGALQFVPGLGLAVSGYNALHRGSEVRIASGSPFRILIGDDLATGDCFVPPPSAPNVR